MAFAVNGAGLPEAAFNEVSDGTSKAKQEARFRFYTLHDTLKRKRYRPQAVRLKMIPISDWTWCNSKAGLPYDSLRCKGNRKAQCGKTACCV